VLVLRLNRELPPAEITGLLGHLFAIEAASVAELLSGASSQLYYEFRSLQQAQVPRSNEPSACFFVELCVYPHGQLATIYDSNLAFARVFSKESHLPIIVYDERRPLEEQSPYRWLLTEEGVDYEVVEEPEDEEAIAITVTAENKVGYLLSKTVPRQCT
jgi:hypothetical protein